MMLSRIHTILTIAGTDPTGCAGIVADIKTISALGGYALAVPTAIIAQNSDAVYDQKNISSSLLSAQLHAVYQAMPIDAIKIGVLPSINSIKTTSAFLRDYARDIPCVFDPVLYASSGQTLVSISLLVALKRYLFPYISLMTPNLDEAAQLLGCSPAKNRAAMVQQAQMLQQQGDFDVLLKGGHLEGEEGCPDFFLSHQSKPHWLDGERITTSHTRGTGCTLSSAIAFYLIEHDAATAVKRAKAYLTKCLATASHLRLMSKRGPLSHFDNT